MMTEKRFERIYEDVDVFCRDHNAKGISQLIEREDYDKIVDLWNALHDKNEQLKQQIGNLEHTKDFCAECCERLEKENEELKFEIRKVQREYEQLWMQTYK